MRGPFRFQPLIFLVQKIDLEEIYDSSKGSTAGTNLMGVISGFLLKDYVPIFINPKLHPNLYIFCQLGIFMIVIYFFK